MNPLAGVQPAVLQCMRATAHYPHHMTSNQTPLPTAPTAPADRLPIIRFLLLFIALLVVATGLAALSFAA